MLWKTLRGRTRLLPHESGRVRRGSLKEAAAGDLTPGGKQNLQHEIGDYAVRLRHPERLPRRGVLKPQNSSRETSPPQEGRDSPQSDRAASLREFREWRSRRASVQLPPLSLRWLRPPRVLPNPSAFECRWRQPSCLGSVHGRATRVYELRHNASWKNQLAITSNLYFGVNSRFTTSLICFPSTLIPVAAKRAMTFFITVPMSF